METQNTRTRKISNRPLGGVVLVIIGSLLLADRMDLGIPHWVFSWEMILISIGTYIGARHSFRAGSWIVPIIIGVVFLLQEEWLDRDMHHYIWPALLISFGLWMIFRPRKSKWEETTTQENPSGDYLDSSVLFGGVKKKIITKNFQGGRIENFFGGTDLDMMQADFKGTIVLDFNVAFGGVKLVVPPQWNIRNEISAALGGIDDKRPMVQVEDPGKVLVLKGTVIFGGVDIKSY